MEWFKLCFPNIIEVSLNALILICFVTLWLNPKIKQMNKKEDIRDEVVKGFWEQLQFFNINCIEANFNISRNPETLSENINLLGRTILDITIYQDTNKYDLEVFSKSFNDLTTKWNRFNDLLQQNLNNLGDAQIQIQLGTALQNVKDANQKLISEVRDKY